MKKQNTVVCVILFVVFFFLLPSLSMSNEVAYESLSSLDNSTVHQSIEPERKKQNKIDPAHPPIDCPLRKQGIDPHGLKPFQDIDNYISFLEREDRNEWQKPDEVVEALGLSGSETVVDLGAGSGYFTFRLAESLPNGKVIAVEIEPEMMRHIYHRAMTENISNVEVKIVSPNDPNISPEADIVFVCDVLHHIEDKPEWLSKLFSYMRTGAELVIIEFKEGDLPEGPPESIKISEGELVALLNEAGFVLQKEKVDLLPYQYYLVFTRS